MSEPWISLYIYYHEDPTPLLLNCLQPLANRLLGMNQISQYFYIRYWEGGPHVRFRVKPSTLMASQTLKTRLIKEIQAYLEVHPSKVALDSQEYAKASDYFSKFELGQARGFEFKSNNTVRDVEYVPEVQSYGGLQAMPAVEQHFFVSSQVALQMLGQTVTPERRFGQALYLMLSGLIGFTNDPKQLRDWFELYHQNWSLALMPNPAAYLKVFQQRFDKQRQPLLNIIDQFMNPSTQLEGLLAQWQHSLVQLGEHFMQLCQKQQLEYNSQLLLSQDIPLIALNCLHMHNNRFGISLREEAYLTFLLKEALNAWITQGNFEVSPKVNQLSSTLF